MTSSDDQNRPFEDIVLDIHNKLLEISLAFVPLITSTNPAAPLLSQHTHTFAKAAEAFFKQELALIATGRLPSSRARKAQRAP
jgi:hypothetical protein